MLIPALTIMADFMGVVGGAFYGVYVLGIDWHHYCAQLQRVRRQFRLVRRRLQEPVFRRGHRPDQLPSRLPLRSGRRRRRPGGHHGLRLFLRDDLAAGLDPGASGWTRCTTLLAARAADFSESMVDLVIRQSESPYRRARCCGWSTARRFPPATACCATSTWRSPAAKPWR